MVGLIGHVSVSIILRVGDIDVSINLVGLEMDQIASHDNDFPGDIRGFPSCLD